MTAALILVLTLGAGLFIAYFGGWALGWWEGPMRYVGDDEIDEYREVGS